MGQSALEKWFGLSGKVALVTGGTGVLGGAMCRALAAAGARVAVLGRRRERAEALAADIAAAGGTAQALPADVMDPDSLAAARARLLDTWGAPDILVNAAGGNVPGSVVPPEASVFDMAIEDLRQALDLNLLGTILPVHAFGADMARRGRGAIVNISSMAASRAITRVMGYTLAKAAIEAYTRWLAVELAHKWGPGLRVNAIAPGFFITEQNRRLLTEPDGSLTERGRKVIEHTPMRRFGEPEELVAALLWLAGDGASFVTGSVVVVDGGFSCYSGV